VVLDTRGVEATDGLPVTLLTGTIANGSTLSIGAPDIAAGVADEGKVCDAPDELEAAALVSPACVVVVEEFPFA
jgi:hypothetical protein